MKRIAIKWIIGLSLALGAVLGAGATSYKTKSYPYNQGINIIPKPKVLKVYPNDKFTVINSMDPRIYYRGEAAKHAASFFREKLWRAFSEQLDEVTYPLEPEPQEFADWHTHSIHFRVDSTLNLGPEGYTLKVHNFGIIVTGKTPRGLFWGMQTLLQLFPAEIERQEAKANEETPLLYIPSVMIEDEPAFPYRGVMLDPSRHFATVEEVKRHIDILSMFKINKLHWHLTDDQGWRIEIKKYPRLTEVGSKRTPNPMTKAHNGYYTQEEVKDIVAYAAARNVEIIPEIEMPGHAMGAIAAYPELACNPTTQKGNPYRVRDLWSIEDDVYCAGSEQTYTFLQDVIDEVAPLFPSEYFHVGGDECPKIRWEKCPKCQARIKAEGLKDEHELQSYVIRRAVQMLQKHGKKLIGWDEILEGGLAPSATVMSWRGEKGGIESANMGHDVIMTPGDGGLYIDFYQGDPKIEPVAISGYVPLEKTYSYYPVPEKIAPEKRHHILGAQVNVWGEYLYSDSIRQYRSYPRVMALAEAVWTPREGRDYADFCRRINNAYVRLDAHQINYHIPQPEQPYGSCNFVAFTDSTSLVLKTSRPIEILYTLDGSDPVAESSRYKEPIQITRDMVVKVASLLPSGRMSTVRAITFQKQKLRPSIKLAKKPIEGLQTLTSVGDYNEAKDLVGVKNWTRSSVRAVPQIIPDKLRNSLEEFPRKAVIAQGYIYVPEDGVYFFSTNYDEFWIGDKCLIDNAGEVKKFSRRDTSIALKAGYHPVKIVFIGAVHGGFPSYWDDGKVQQRLSTSPTWEDIKVYRK